MLSGPLLLSSSRLSFHFFTVLGFSNHKNKNKVFLAGNKTCDKLSKMSTFLYVIWFLRASYSMMMVVTVSSHCGENDWLLSSRPTHHVNYWASQEYFFYNAESLCHLSTSKLWVAMNFCISLKKCPSRKFLRFTRIWYSFMLGLCIIRTEWI
jgi:hypothetical protein